MRAAVAATFAAGALAVPYVKRQDVVTDWDVEYATVVVTVTAPAYAAATSVADPASDTPNTGFHWGHGWQPWSSWTGSQQTTATADPAPSSTPEADPTTVAPTTSVYVPPTTSSVYVPPTSSAAPSPSVEPTTQAPPPPSSTQAPPPPSSTQAPPPPSSTASPVPVSSSSPTTSADTGTATTYQEITVHHHNIHRSNHSAPSIAWDDALAGTAQKIAASCVYAHNVEEDGGGYGQNIAAGVEANNISAIITDLFYNGEVGWFDGLYGQAQPDMTNFEHWGHFSQVVWKDTTHVGCYTQDCSSTGLSNVSGNVSPFFTVCNYKNPGNYQNEYGDNIGQSVGDATAAWNDGM